MNTPPKRSYRPRHYVVLPPTPAELEECGMVPLPSLEQIEITSLKAKLEAIELENKEINNKWETVLIENARLKAKLAILQSRLPKCMECFDVISAPPSYKYKVCMKCIKREKRTCTLCQKIYTTPFFTRKDYKCFSCCKSPPQPQTCTPNLEDLD